MKIVLVAEVAGLGKPGEVEEVSPGYARNYLFPNQLALPATPDAVQNWEARKKAQEKRQAQARQGLEAVAQRLGEMVLTIQAKKGAGERLYGSITSAHIAQGLASQGIEIDRRKIDLPQPIKTIGSHTVVVKVGPGLADQLQVKIEGA